MAKDSERRRNRSVESMEIREAGGILGVAQKAIAQAESLAARGTRAPLRPLTRERLRVAREAADDAQRAINAELDGTF